MDPVTAFSLACGIVQLLDVCSKVGSGALEFYKNGSLQQNRRLQDQAKQLRGLSSGLSMQHSDFNPSNTARNEHLELIEVAQKCDTITAKLLVELDKLNSQASRNVMTAFARSIKARLKVPAIQGLLAELHECQGILDTRLLISIKQGIPGMTFALFSE